MSAHVPRSRIGWGLLARAGDLERFHASEVLPSIADTPPGCLAIWPALVFRTREDARAFARSHFPDRQPRIVRARAVVEQCTRLEGAKP